jgi:hypothetical protein
MDIDVETGLPQLPEGQWWAVFRGTERVTTNGAAWRMDDRVYVAIMTKGYRYEKRWFKTIRHEQDMVVSREVVKTQLGRQGMVFSHDVNAKSILASAQRLLEQIEANRRYQELLRNRAAKVDQYLGSYPPKKLEETK